MNQKLMYSLINAGIVGGIVFLSSLPTQYPPTLQVLYQACIGAGLALLTQVKSIIEGLTGNGKGGTEETLYGVPVVKSENQDRKMKLGMLV